MSRETVPRCTATSAIYDQPVEATKVFISWSGKPALGIARVWHDLLEDIFDDSVDVFVSDDIAAGKRGLDEIRLALEDAVFAIVIVTRANQSAQWLNFEAGAIANQLRVENGKSARVAPFLVDIERGTDVVGPIAQFQMKLFGRDGVEKIILSLASVVGATVATHQKRFARLWDSEYAERFNEAREAVIDEPPSHPSESQKRPIDDVLGEILSVVRELRSAPATQSVTSQMREVTSETADEFRSAIQQHLSGWSWARQVDQPALSVSISPRRNATVRLVFPDKVPDYDLMRELVTDIEEIADRMRLRDARVQFTTVLQDGSKTQS